MDPFLTMIKSCPPTALDSHLDQLGILISMVKSKINPYLDQVFGLVKDFWNPGTNLLITILSLIKSIALDLGEDLRVFMPMILPDLLAIPDKDTSSEKISSLKALSVLVALDTNIKEYLHLAVPTITRILERSDSPIPLKKSAIQAAGSLCKKLNFSDFASRIILPLIRMLGSPTSGVIIPIKGIVVF